MAMSGSSTSFGQRFDRVLSAQQHHLAAQGLGQGCVVLPWFGNSW